jgi:hypothetical protein
VHKTLKTSVLYLENSLDYWYNIEHERLCSP